MEPANWSPGAFQNITIHNTRDFRVITQHKNGPSETSYHPHNHGIWPSPPPGETVSEFDSGLYHFLDEAGNIVRLRDGRCSAVIGGSETHIIV